MENYKKILKILETKLDVDDDSVTEKKQCLCEYPSKDRIEEINECAEAISEAWKQNRVSSKDLRMYFNV